jgi:glycosyltransferase involved in cell wall biosynthesis
MKTLRIGIDGEGLRKPLSGVGQYIYNLCAELERLWPEAQFFAYARLPAERLALPSPRWVLRREAVPALRRLPSFLWLRTRGAALCRADGLDVFWAGRSLHPRLAGVRTVCTVHDLNHLLVPETMEWPTRISHGLWFSGDLKRADAVLTNSRGTAQRLQEMLRIATDDVVLPGLHERFRPSFDEPALRELGIVPPYLLSVATLEPRKNVGTLLQAFLQLRRSGELRDHRLVLVGARGWQDRALEAELIAARDEGVVVTGYVSDALMPALYTAADALVCPSLYEGFGMPVLEARACGTRIVVADSPELREAGGPDAVAVQPTVEGVRNGIRRALRRPRPDEHGLAQRHAWRRSAQRLADALQPNDPAGERSGAAPALQRPETLMESE